MSICLWFVLDSLWADPLDSAALASTLPPTPFYRSESRDSGEA